MSDRTTDKALENPESDLLDLAPHAKMLAQVVSTATTPFTIGVYGEWGAGKTTFSNFVKHYLDESAKGNATRKVEFIRFEAWPFKTADELWRALIIKIAAHLYGRADRPTPEPQPKKKETWREWLGRPAIDSGDDAKPTNDEQEYAALLGRLDDTLYGGIGKTASARWRLDQEQVLTTAVKAGFAALSAASPFMAGVRGLLNLDDEKSSNAPQEQNKATRDRIESIDGFRKVLKDLLEKRAVDKQGHERRLCIFLDDLDRCTPDVALDLLDAIKVFLSDSRFVFILAADERIIGRGLRMRYREIAQTDNKADADAEALRQEGEKYFEKIVQLRIVIPEPRAKIAHRYIAAEFPEWMPATDIVFVALGGNPRRVKQFCNWMMYRHAVEKHQWLPANSRDSEQWSDADELLLNKMIALNARSEHCLRAIAQLAVDGGFQDNMRSLEVHLKKLGEDAAAEKVREKFPTPMLAELCQEISDSEPLFALIQEPPLLSGCPALKVETFAAIADMRPGTKVMLDAYDRVFMRILQGTSGSVTPQSLVISDFSRLSNIESASTGLLESLRKLAESSGLAWTKNMLEIEAAVQSSKTADEMTDPDMKSVMTAVNQLPVAQDQPNDRRALVLDTPRLSEMLREVVLAYCTRQAQPQDDKPMSKHVAERASDRQKKDTVAKKAWENLDAVTKTDIEQRIRLRRQVADHCLYMRSFTKLNALERFWPDVARKLREQFLGLRALESALALNQPIEPRYIALWNAYMSNEPLCEFLKLQPLFGNIDEMHVQKYLEYSQAVAPTVETATVAASAPAATLMPMPDIAAQGAAEFSNIHLKFVTTTDNVGGLGGDISHYDVTRNFDGGKTSYRVKIDWHAVDELNELLKRFAEMGPNGVAPTRELMGTTRLNELASLGDFAVLMREIGAATFEMLFPAENGVRAEVESLLRTYPRVRLIVDAPTEIMRVPFEAMYSRNQRTFVALSQDVSLVRQRESSKKIRRLPLEVPLRILAVLSNPPELPPLNLEGEREVLMRVLEPALAANRVVVKFLGRGEASWEKIRNSVQSFRPHVFHFMGHGWFGTEGGGQEERGALVLDGPDGGSHILAAPEFATLLGEEQIQIAVLNGCDTGTASRNEAISSLADALTNSGVPSVIATMRLVSDDTALRFTREFYRALCEGRTVETALAEARKALSVERRDWSVYALFASMLQLELLKIPPATQQRGSANAAPP